MESYKDHKFIVFCVDHYNPLGVVRSLGEVGIKPIVIIYDKAKPFIIPSSKYYGKIYWVTTIEEGYEILLKEYSHETYKPFIYTCSDDIESFLDLHYDELIDKFYFFDGGCQGQITKVMEKNELCKLAVESGIDIPKTEEVNVGDLPKKLRYPIITKAVISTLYNWKGNIHICYNEQELLDAYKTIRGERIILQEFIKKKNELCLDGLSVNHGEEVYLPVQAKYLRFTDKSYGNYIFFEKMKELDLLEKIKKLMKKTQYSGIFEIEFLRDKDDHFYFLEVNFRNSTWSYAHTDQGINLPLIYAKSVLAGHLVTDGVQQKKDTFTAMDECADFKEAVMGRKVSLLRWYKEMRGCDTLFYSKKGDMRPLYAYVWHRVMGVLKSVLHLNRE